MLSGISELPPASRVLLRREDPSLVLADIRGLVPRRPDSGLIPTGDFFFFSFLEVSLPFFQSLFFDLFHSSGAIFSGVRQGSHPELR